MKRSSASAELDIATKMARRQDPVSCQFCRRKKLKCDRIGPCSNCRARKLVCSLSSGGFQARGVPNVAVLPEVEHTEDTSSDQTVEELKSRVKRLEELLAPKSDLVNDVYVTESPHHPHTKVPSLQANDATEKDGQICKTVSSMETDNFEHVPPPCSKPFSENLFADTFGSFFFSLSQPRLAPSLQSNLADLLPRRNQGEALLTYYFENMDWVYRIVHVPTCNDIFNDLYTSIENGQKPAYAYLALISAIFASSAFFCSPTSGLFVDRDDAVALSRQLGLLAQDSLTAADCLAHPTIETLQSLIVLTQWVMPNIGAIATLRTLSSTLMHTARSMGLHLTDSLENKRWRMHNEVNWVEVEVKRRIWWHITSTDWLLSFMGGAQNSTYMVHPKHMNVDFPTNVNDISITANGNYAQPDHVPTEMTFFRFRCRGTTLFREVVDAAWEVGSAIEDLPYDTVLQFDRKFRGIIQEFDSVFDKYRNVLTAVHTSNRNWQTKMSPNIHWAMAHFCMDSRFAHLHRPYLVRGARDPKYAYSRMICLRSARSLMELGNTILTSSKNLIAFKLWAIKHHMYVATLILVMDFCFNRNEPRAKERREEIMECFEALKLNENGRSTIPPGLKKLEKMVQELNDHSENISPCPTTWKASAAADLKAVPQLDRDPGQQPAANASLGVYGTHTPNLLVGGNNFTDALSQQPWVEFDFSSSDNNNFETTFDTSLFDELFQNLDDNSDLI